MRVGIGFDLHAFGLGEHVTLGGVQVPYEQGVVAHSDGDVLVHALCDALLGAMGLGDIGEHFPDSDPQWYDADSRLFLRHCKDLMRSHGWRLVNADVSVVAEAPKIGPYRAQMKANLGADLEVPADRINVKATTCERLGAIGRSEGLACHAIVLLAYAHGNQPGH